jgi:peroxiredoxin Q/BCP
MAQLRQDHARFAERNAVILVVGPEDRATFATYWKATNMPFVGLPDPEHTALKLYGQEVKLLRLGRMPAQVVVDVAGVARYVHYGRSMADIPPNGEILTLLDELNQENESA